MLLKSCSFALLPFIECIDFNSIHHCVNVWAVSAYDHFRLPNYVCLWNAAKHPQISMQTKIRLNLQLHCVCDTRRLFTSIPANNFTIFFVNCWRKRMWCIETRTLFGNIRSFDTSQFYTKMWITAKEGACNNLCFIKLTVLLQSDTRKTIFALADIRNIRMEAIDWKIFLI